MLKYSTGDRRLHVSKGRFLICCNFQRNCFHIRINDGMCSNHSGGIQRRVSCHLLCAAHQCNLYGDERVVSFIGIRQFDFTYDVTTSGHLPALKFLIGRLSDRGVEVSSIDELRPEFDPGVPRSVRVGRRGAPRPQQSHQFYAPSWTPRRPCSAGNCPRNWRNCPSCGPCSTTARATASPARWPACSSRKSQATRLQSGRPHCR